MEKFNPSPGYILAEVLESSSDTLITNQPQKKCKVAAVGKEYMENRSFVYPPCKPGDIIIHTTVGFETLTLNDKEHRIISFRNILGTYEK